MTTEREQLELAAKACGFYTEWDGVAIYVWIGKPSKFPPNASFNHFSPDWAVWNPARDDGDCARMEAQLGIELTWFFDRVDALACDVATFVRYFKDHNGDKNAARRAASVAVAAEIGRLK